MSKILFLTSSHRFDDDRIFFHQAKELLKQGFSIKICSLSAEFSGEKEGIQIESFSILETSIQNKIQTFKKVINSFDPDLIICSEPIAVIATKDFAKRKNIHVVYDITEWYPSMRMVERFSFPMNLVHAVKFFLVQLYAGFLSSHYIFGEETKKFPLAYFFPFKKKLISPYYPDDVYIHQNIKKLDPNKITLCYTGQFSEEKGIGNFFEVIDSLSEKKTELEISILLVGGARKEKDEQYFQKLLSKYQFPNITITKSTSFESFTSSYADADICFDLRSLNFENHHCLPIKIFYYIASGKPVIYTDLKATRIHMDVSKFGHLVDPKDANAISDYIIKYIENPEIYSTHAHQARVEYEKRYNWNAIKNDFVDFIKKAIK
ncbi:glycosyltransferase [Kaistella montana]|uniref:Glycosyltransferase n=1 Tax=Kaistella montana TaxID=1849733 RepID=A0ABW5KBM1_9FLAO|nr:glycosyltransferase [Kaistella montana]MCQ4035667.1 glycosyltransferase [Kaistella montana]